ncbi:MAG: hypothetical protein H7276_08165 [Caulobacter sp.]|nr:hypothetical protein [Vitreoscilla sp.]
MLLAGDAHEACESTPALRAKLQNMETQLRRLGEKLRTSTVAISRSR